MTNSSNQTRNAALGILLAFILTNFAIFINKLFFGIDITNINAFWVFLSRIYIWIALAVVFFYAVKTERQPFLLWQDKKHKWWKYILFAVSIYILYLIGGVVFYLIFKSFGIDFFKDNNAKIKAVAHILKSNIPLLVLICITAGITEELLFRGYMLPRLIHLLKSPAAAIIVSALLFTVVHISWGTLGEIVGPFCLGILFAVFYWKYRNIKFLIVFHFLWDLFALLMQVHHYK